MKIIIAAQLMIKSKLIENIIKKLEPSPKLAVLSKLMLTRIIAKSVQDTIPTIKKVQSR